MVELSDIRKGSIVQVRGDFGRMQPVRAVVTEVDYNIVDGHPGISYIVNGHDPEYWAYLHQIDFVEKY